MTLSKASLRMHEIISHRVKCGQTECPKTLIHPAVKDCFSTIRHYLISWSTTLVPELITHNDNSFGYRILQPPSFGIIRESEGIVTPKARKSNTQRVVVSLTYDNVMTKKWTIFFVCLSLRLDRSP